MYITSRTNIHEPTTSNHAVSAPTGGKRLGCFKNGGVVAANGCDGDATDETPGSSLFPSSFSLYYNIAKAPATAEQKKKEFPPQRTCKILRGLLLAIVKLCVKTAEV